MKDNGLSVIIPSYNTEVITLRCINLLERTLRKSDIPYEIIVVDNGSTDGSQKILTGLASSHIKIILNSTNEGYSKANNKALRIASLDHILFLNSDVFIETKIDFKELFSFFDKNGNIGALTVRVVLNNGTIDPASHRGFPTIWRSFCYFSGLEKIFSGTFFLNKLFGGYHLAHLDQKIIHEIDSPTGAFYMAPRKLLTKLKGFDEDYFMYGEDLDLSYRIKKHGYKIVYYPKFEVIHHKYQSGLQNKEDNALRRKTKKYFYEAMTTFYKKHYENSHPLLLNKFIYFLINMGKRMI